MARSGSARCWPRSDWAPPPSSRQVLAREFGADQVVAERGKDGAKAVREIFDGLGADFVLECVGTKDSMNQATMCARPGGRLSLIHISEPTRQAEISYAVFCLKKKK